MRRTLCALALCGTALAAGAEDIPPERRAALLNLLRQDCGSCHGMTLKGGLGPALLPENLAGKPDELLVTTILQGRPGTAMPPWQSFMAPAEAQWLVRQLREKSW
jgi:cytochrome c55X